MLCLRVAFVVIVVAGVALILAIIAKKSGDLWDFYGCLERAWIRLQIEKCEEYEAHLRVSKLIKRKKTSEKPAVYHMPS